VGVTKHNDECGGAIWHSAEQFSDSSIETKSNCISFNSHQVMTIIALVSTRNTNTRASQSNIAVAHVSDSCGKNEAFSRSPNAAKWPLAEELKLQQKKTATPVYLNEIYISVF
jgi:hypothetical protein